jgi:DNA-binding MarR family transcriptional regulator
MRQLLEMAYVLESHNEDDKRVKALRLSAAGQKLLQELNKTQSALLQKVFDNDEAMSAWTQKMQALAKA